ATTRCDACTRGTASRSWASPATRSRCSSTSPEHPSDQVLAAKRTRRTHFSHQQLGAKPARGTHFWHQQLGAGRVRVSGWRSRETAGEDATVRDEPQEPPSGDSVPPPAFEAPHSNGAAHRPK